MLSKIKSWFADNEMQLTWFFIGVFLSMFVADVEAGNYFGALLDSVIVAVNYAYRPR